MKYFLNLDSNIQAAIIAGIVSVIIFVIGKFIEWIIVRSKLKVEKMEVYSKYVEISLEKKLETYQRLLQIIRNVGLGSHYNTGKKEKISDIEKIEINRIALIKILDWEHENGGFFLLSSESYERFKNLKNRLKAFPEFNLKYS